VDIRAGLTPLDQHIADCLRKLGKPYFIAANKADEQGELYSFAEFYELGPTAIVPVSAEHRLGVADLWENIFDSIPAEVRSVKIADVQTKVIPSTNEFKICIVGRPNAGKSSLLNAIIGEERVIATDVPGTTTDPVDVEFEHGDYRFTLVDTAGIRRHAKRKDDVENLSVMYAERNLAQADLAFLVLDAEDGITSQDETIAALIEESGCAAIVLANKWDKAPEELRQQQNGLEKFAEMAKKQMPFLEFAPLVALSAKAKKIYGSAAGADQLDAAPWPEPKNFSELWDFVADIIKAREYMIPAEELSEVIRHVIAVGPKVSETVGSLRRPHQVGNRPPQFMVYVKAPDKVPESFRRYLSRLMRERYGYRGHPIRWVFKRN
jgi:GTP-binding protein